MSSEDHPDPSTSPTTPSSAGGSPAVSASTLQKALARLPEIGTLVKDRPYRQVWRFVHAGQAYYLKFYPRANALKRLFRGSPALREFFRLQWLAKAHIPAPRAIACLSGFRLNNRIGDALIMSAIEPGITLDALAHDHQRRGEAIPDHHALRRRMIELLQRMARAGLGHDDLHLGNFLLSNGRLYLLDAYAVRRGGLKLAHLRQLAHSLRSIATRSDLLRGWTALASGPMPARGNPVSRRWWRIAERRGMGENRYFGKLKLDEWRGHYFRLYKYPPRGSIAAALSITARDWRDAWPRLMEQMTSGQLDVLKRTASGEVLGGEVILAGRPVPVIIKHPRRKLWYRYINEIGRGSRSRRAWKKSLWLLARGLPTAWPLLLMERRVLGYVVDQYIVFERVPGITLDRINLDELPHSQREMLLRRAGRLLRQLERDGLYHYDAKSSNWIVRPDEKLGATPVLIDVDGIRRRPWIALGIERLLRSMKDHPEYTPYDSLALCQGYAASSRIHREEVAMDKMDGLNDDDGAHPN